MNDTLPPDPLFEGLRERILALPDPRQRKFIQEYLIDNNASRAAREAGWSRGSAGEIGRRLLKRPEIRGVIDSFLSIQGTDIASRIGRQALVAKVMMERLLDHELPLGERQLAQKALASAEGQITEMTTARAKVEISASAPLHGYFAQGTLGKIADFYRKKTGREYSISPELSANHNQTLGSEAPRFTAADAQVLVLMNEMKCADKIEDFSELEGQIEIQEQHQADLEKPDIPEVSNQNYLRKDNHHEPRSRDHRDK